MIFSTRINQNPIPDSHDDIMDLDEPFDPIFSWPMGNPFGILEPNFVERAAAGFFGWGPQVTHCRDVRQIPITLIILKLEGLVSAGCYHLMPLSIVLLVQLSLLYSIFCIHRLLIVLSFIITSHQPVHLHRLVIFEDLILYIENFIYVLFCLCDRHTEGRGRLYFHYVSLYSCHRL